MLASIHTGSSNRLWTVLADEATRCNDALYIFAGGRLECRENFEYLRSSVYQLANAGNLDALVSWSSSIGGFVPVEDLVQFHKRFSNLPFVSVGMKIDGKPSVNFNAYSGMKAAVAHCISHHGARKIAFVRGPDQHVSAQDRYRSYVDALSEYGIPFDPNLVSSPTSWSSGDEALDELVVGRQLVPGKDFDTLVCASDLMMFQAGKRLEAMGIDIPGDLRLVGFNDTHESQLLRVPCTTVSMPYVQMGIMAYDTVARMVDSHDVLGEGDILLPAELVVRRSCGCTDSLGGIEHAREVITDSRSYFRWLSHAMRINEQVLHQHVDPLIDLALNGTAKSLEKGCTDLLEQFFAWGGDVNLLYEALRWLQLFLPLSDDMQSFLSHDVPPLVGQMQSRTFNLSTFESSRRGVLLNSLKCDLLCIRSVANLGEVLHRHLPQLGIDAAFVVLNEGDTYSRLVGGFLQDTLFEHQREFSMGKLLPSDIRSRLGTGIYVVQPLFMENQPLGYFIIRTTSRSGELFEELRSSLSSAIKGTFLLDAANLAREQAEKAQRSRSEFFANVSDGLRDPLEQIRNLAALGTDTRVTQDIGAEIDKASHLLDLALVQTGELELDRRLCDADALLRQACQSLEIPYLSKRLPSVVLDEERLFQMVSIIARKAHEEGVACSVQAEAGVDGLVVRFLVPGWNPVMAMQDPGLLLCEQIMLMHDGRCEITDEFIACTFAWPTLGGHAGRQPVRYDGPAWFLGEPTWSFDSGFPPVAAVSPQALVSGEVPGTTPSVFVWDAEQSGFDSFAALHAIKSDPRRSEIPFLALGLPPGAPTLDSAVEALAISQGGVVVFVLGDVPPALLEVVAPRDVLRLEDVHEYMQAASQNPPSLLLMGAPFGPSDITYIRGLSVAGNVPVLLVRDVLSNDETEQLCLLPRVIVCDPSMFACQSFVGRINGIQGGDDILPALTGALVKRAVAFLQANATLPISRWQLAEAVHVSEDYLTRIFRSELGLSPWEYLNRYRIHLASKLLQGSALTINEIASRTGFQDQAYFCRVFKKITGTTPGKIRSR